MMVQELDQGNMQMKRLCDELTKSAATHGSREQHAVDQITKGNNIIAQFAEALQKCKEKLKRKQSILLRQVLVCSMCCRSLF